MFPKLILNLHMGPYCAIPSSIVVLTVLKFIIGRDWSWKKSRVESDVLGIYFPVEKSKKNLVFLIYVFLIRFIVGIFFLGFGI